MLAALDAASAVAGIGLGFVLGLVLALALGRRGEPWVLDWRLRVERRARDGALCGSESDETGPGGMETPEDRPGAT